ncbi:hypothetical protein M9Y10_009782 [Tritrichomonas musculus]|uniref:Ap4A phosphorylase 1/2 N-terminal domain-containing protein n=1 Tax=Tritrichomonas musculus TaxID=1915356 RepID=A0ABR2IQP1_9EUKA
MSLKNKILDCAQAAINSKNAFHLFLPKSESTIDHGFKFILHYYDPVLLKYLSVLPTERKDNPLLPPFEPNLHVCDLKDGANHHLLINKYMQCKGHVVISSVDKNAKQGSDLDILDFNAFEQIFKSFDGEGMMYYNSGLNSGCSQLHKHLQYTPVEELPILEAMIEKKLPIHNHVLDLSRMSAKTMLDTYNELLKMSKSDSPHDSYNFIIFKNKAFYIPRKISQHKCGIVLNSFAISGNYSLWTWSDLMIKEKPLQILKDVCFPTVY